MDPVVRAYFISLRANRKMHGKQTRKSAEETCDQAEKIQGYRYLIMIAKMQEMDVTLHRLQKNVKIY